MVTDNENWIIEEGDVIIRKEVPFGIESLSDWEKLVYCLWTADYSLRNAGDLQVAKDLYVHWQTEGLRAASKIGLSLTVKLFSLSATDLQRQYFDLFEEVCTEIRGAKPRVT